MRRALMNKLQDVWSDADKCMRCANCLASCPVLTTAGFSVFPGPRNVMGEAPRPFEEINATRDLFYLCTTCGHCREVCPSGINTPQAMSLLRSAVAEKGYEDFYIQSAAKSTTKFKNPYTKEQIERCEWAKGFQFSKNSNILFYAGCTYSFNYPDVLKSTINILQKADIEVQYLQENEECCGIMLYDGGYLEDFQVQLEANIKRFEETGIDLLITPCPGCYGMIQREYRKFANYNFHVQHFTEFLVELINQNKVKLKNLDATVTWHDPCHLSRKMRIFDEPRQIIESIPGVKFKEMPNTKYDSFCCGAGGAVLASRADVSIKLAKRRIKEAENIGADIILTMCPACESILEKAIRYLAWEDEEDEEDEDFELSDSGLKLLDLATLISQCIL